MEIKIFSKENCPNCVIVKNLFKTVGLPFTEAKIVSSGEADGVELITREDFFEAVPNARSVPQVVIDGDIIGGLPQVREFLKHYE